MEPKYGVVYKVQPEPLEPSACTPFEAGAVTFILEYRDVDPERLERAYADRPEDLAEIRRFSPVGGFTDTGVSIHVLGTVLILALAHLGCGGGGGTPDANPGEIDAELPCLEDGVDQGFGRLHRRLEERAGRDP